MTTEWEQSKRDGNTSFGTGDFAAAVEHYTASLKSSLPTPQERAVLLNNRAMAYLKLARNELAVEDCTASLIQSTDVDTNIKALFRRATAYEALGLTKDALSDFKGALEKGPTEKSAQAGLLRCEVKLGLPPSRVGGVVASGGSGGGGRRAVSDEEARGLVELQSRLKEVKKQQLRAGEQRRGAELERKKSQLTAAQLSQLPTDRPVYTAVGRMYAASSVATEIARMEDAGKKAEDKVKVCEVTLKHLGEKEKEEEAAFMEALEAIKRRK